MDKHTMRDHLEDTMNERNNALETARQWQAVAAMYYAQHDNRRSCSLFAPCKSCDAYEAMVNRD